MAPLNTPLIEILEWADTKKHRWAQVRQSLIR